MTKLTIHHIARIEGHGNVEIDISKGEIRRLELRVVEPQRYFESLVVGRRVDEVPLIVSRICGICSPNHTITALRALECALGIEVSEYVHTLRTLLVYGSFLQNHATHLYLLSAPDYVGLPSAFPLADSMPDVLARALELKRLGNDLCAVVGGRSVHPATAVLGGFTALPTRRELTRLSGRLRLAVHDAAETAALFKSFAYPDFHPHREFLALSAAGDYAIVGDWVRALKGGWTRPVSEYRDFICEREVEGGNAKLSETDGAPFMVGALARVRLNWDELKPSARVAASSAGIRPGDDNPYLNNLCQALELVDAAERCAEMCDWLADNVPAAAGTGRELSQKSLAEPLRPSSQNLKPSSSAKPEALNQVQGDGAPGNRQGAAATEAPRGTLYHSYEVNESGIVVAGDVITPTAQNLACLEADLRLLAPTLADLPQEDAVLRVEQLIRAYDPCLSCAVH
ncbi:MAG: Ni/Fe hydrogenase subunit alpha [Actinomycetes bacterium]|jgi:coenzyme F420-reducing hydrogenase alpha subunit|nr:Ni/Fe hydrogenase subunit alpha [Actinomycetes bacterium]